MAYSFSQLGVYERCPARYKFQYIDKAKPSYVNQDLARLGVNVHTAIEKDDVAFVMNSVEGRNMYYYAKELLKSIPKERTFELKLAIDENGLPVSFDSDKAFLRGVIDLVAGFTLYDWKTGFKEPTPAQMGMYYLLCTGNDIYVNSAVYVMLRSQKAVMVDLDYQLMDDAKKWIEKTVTSITRDKEFERRVGKSCDYCPYRQNCLEALGESEDTQQNRLAKYIVLSSELDEIKSDLKKYVQETGLTVKSGEIEFGTNITEFLTVKSKPKLLEALKSANLIENFATISSDQYPNLLEMHPEFSCHFKRSIRETVGIKKFSLNALEGVNLRE